MDQRPANERGAAFEDYVVPGGSRAATAKRS